MKNNNEKLKLEAIRTQLGYTRQTMAEKMHISLDRYNRLATGESKMLATEFCAIHAVSGFDYEKISPVQ